MSGRARPSCAPGMPGSGDHAGQEHHRLLQQHYGGQPRALHACATCWDIPRVRIYVGSWTEWAERVDLPIEAGSGAAGEAEAVSGERYAHRDKTTGPKPESASARVVTLVAFPLPASPLPRLSRRNPASQLSRPPDPSRLHDPFDRVQIVDVLERILAEQHQVGVAAGLDGAEPAGRLAADAPGRRHGWRRARQPGASGRPSPPAGCSSPKSEARSLAGP